MSWSVSVGNVPVQPVSSIRDALEAAFKTANPTETPDSPTVNIETIEQFNFAMETVVDIAKKHLVHKASDSDATLNVSLSGHTNPNHDTVPNYSNDSIHISVARAFK